MGGVPFENREVARSTCVASAKQRRAVVLSRTREWLGVVTKDLPKYLRATGRTNNDWVRLCNRYECLEFAPEGGGVRCDWEWTSMLHAPLVMPWLGRRIFRRVLQSHCFEFRSAPLGGKAEGKIDVTFVIGHRGLDRLPCLISTLYTIAGQEGVRIECIVVEQSTYPEIRNRLPPWVRYVYTPLPCARLPYCRAWALNVGARMARGDLLILHDNDLLVSARYALEHFGYLEKGYEVVNLKRFIFYLDKMTTDCLFAAGRLPVPATPQSILQNALGGGSLAIAKDAFFAIGGYDEAFVGWGGEDNEFWDRAQLRSLYPYGHLPLVHLWHPGQPDKGVRQGKGAYTADLYNVRSRINPRDRVRELVGRDFGRIAGPDPMPVVFPR